MKVDKDMIKRVASNARVNLTDKEIEDFIPEFKEILDHSQKVYTCRII